MMKKTLLYLVLIANFTLFAQGNILFEQANKAYEKEQYTEAIDSYSRLLHSNTLNSPELYYNLANAYYKTDKIAPSIYYYEKALALKPNDKDVQENLTLAKRMRVDNFDVISEPFLAKVLNVFTSFFAVDIWAVISIAFAILFLILFILYFLKRKRVFFIGFWISLSFVLYSFFAANYQLNKANNNSFAIVFDKEVPLQKEAKLTADAIEPLHEGTKVKILKQDGDWTKVQLSDGRVGWLPNESVKLL
jgi:tetratricopeptide (TPR) repeat protein